MRDTGAHTGKYIVKYEGIKWLWKPGFGDEEGDNTTNREVVAYKIGKLLGNVNVPRTRRIQGWDWEEGWECEGSIQEWITGASSFSSMGKFVDDEAVLLFDFLLGNTDRHSQNIIRDRNGKDWLIDHGRLEGYSGQGVRWMFNRYPVDYVEQALVPWTTHMDTIKRLLNSYTPELIINFDKKMEDVTEWVGLRS
jgi:hypothetical protein